MTNLFVQFTDESETAIATIFSCPQNATEFPNQGQIVTSDSRYAAYYAALPSSIAARLPSPG